MNNQKLQTFIDLVAFDQHLSALESMIILSEKKLQKLQADSIEIQKKIEDKIAQKKELKKEYDLQELFVADLQAKDTHQSTVIERAKNSKECEAANKELLHIRAELARQEKKLVQLWNNYQMIQKDVDVMHVEQVQKAAEIEAEISKEQEQLVGFKKDLENQTSLRKSKVDLLPQEWIHLYENMRGRVINPVVPVAQDACSACFYSIASRDLQSLRQNGLMPCKDCYRFLFIDEKSVQDSK